MESNRNILVLLCVFALILLILGLVYWLIHRRMTARNEGKNTRKARRMNLIFTLVATLALMVFAVIYNNLTFYDASVTGAYEDGEEAIKTMATEFENYLTVASTTLRVTADSVDLMKAAGRSVDEIEQYIVAQTKRQAEQFDENYTGIYGIFPSVTRDGHCVRFRPIRVLSAHTEKRPTVNEEYITVGSSVPIIFFHLTAKWNQTEFCS